MLLPHQCYSLVCYQSLSNALQVPSLNQIAKLRADDLHCHESAGARPLILKVGSARSYFRKTKHMRMVVSLATYRATWWNSSTRRAFPKMESRSCARGVKQLTMSIDTGNRRDIGVHRWTRYHLSRGRAVVGLLLAGIQNLFRFFPVEIYETTCL